MSAFVVLDLISAVACWVIACDDCLWNNLLYSFLRQVGRETLTTTLLLQRCCGCGPFCVLGEGMCAEFGICKYQIMCKYFRVPLLMVMRCVSAADEHAEG